MPTEEDEVKYDLAGNALPANRNPSPPGGPGGYGAMPPPGYSGQARPGGGGYGAPGAYGAPGSYGGDAANTSGMRQGVPPEVATLKWNWAAFLGGTSLWWCFFNGAPLWGGILLALPLIAWIPFVGILAGITSLGISIFLGINGHKLAWEGRRFAGGYEEFIEVQRIWLKWAVGLLIAGFLVIPILAAILFPVFQRIRMQQRLHQGGYGRPYGGAYHPYGSGGTYPYGAHPYGTHPYGSGTHHPSGTAPHHARPQ